MGAQYSGTLSRQMTVAAVIWVIVLVALAVLAGLAVLISRQCMESRQPGKRGFGAGGEMLMKGNATFGQRGRRPPRPETWIFRRKLLKFRHLKQLDAPNLRPGDIDFWAEKKGVESRSQALRLLVNMAVGAKKPR